MRIVQGQIEQYVQSRRTGAAGGGRRRAQHHRPGLLADMVAYSPDMTTEQRQELLETIDVVDRLKLVSTFLAKQIEILELKGRIQSEVKSEMDKTQREYILREQMKAIQHELGEDDPQQAEINELREKVEAAGMPEEVKARALKEVDRMSRIPSRLARGRASSAPTSTGSSACPGTSPPTTTSTSRRPRKILDEDHYGLEKIKERILEYLAVRTLADKIRSPDPRLRRPARRRQDVASARARPRHGPQVRAHEPGRHPRRGRDPRPPAHLHRRAARPRSSRTSRPPARNNPVFMLDEIDKIGMDFRGDPSSALLEVLDPEQNNTFQDNYLEVPFDLSQGALHRHGEPARPDPAAAARPDGDHPAARLHRSRRRSRSASASWCPSRWSSTA